MNVLVIGGAGYVGSQICKSLLLNGHTPIIYDMSVVPFDWISRYKINRIFGNINDTQHLMKILKTYKVDIIINTAAYTTVGESNHDPLKYYNNNVFGMISILDAMRNCNVKKIIYSSSSSVYGVPVYNDPIKEDNYKNPINPYGRSKKMCEDILEDTCKAYGIQGISLRYFNVAGADLDNEMGENHFPETHLIPLTLMAAKGLKQELSIFGSDYETNDGTCVRDYTHVVDIAKAHVLALDYEISNVKGYDVFNIGAGRGLSVKQIIESSEKITGKKIPVVEQIRRPGDPPFLMADNQKAKELLGWSPEYSRLEIIISTAWKWLNKSNP